MLGLKTNLKLHVVENNWKAGDIAICVDIDKRAPTNNAPPPLRLKAEYIVNKVRVCECGDTILDVGLVTPNGLGTSCPCGAKSSPKTGIWWCSSNRFVKKQTLKTTKYSTIEEAIENEDYLEAAKMRDLASKV